MNKKELIDDRMHYGKDDVVEVNALELIDLIIQNERMERAFNLVSDRLESAQIALDIYKTRAKPKFVDLRV